MTKGRFGCLKETEIRINVELVEKISEAPQGFMLRPVMCSSLINGLVNETKCTLDEFTGVIELGGMMDAPVGCGAIQKNLSGLER